MTLFKYLFIIACLTPISAQAQNGNQPSATPVIVTEVVRTNFSDKVEALGTLKANESVNLTSSVTEMVTKILFTDNQTVKKGDILIEMDAAEEFAELAEQQSILEESQRQVNRLTPLVKSGAASASVLDENTRNLASAKARVDAIQSRIDQRIIKAPYDGVLGLRNISVGTLIQPGTLITTIDDDSVMKLDFSVPEVFIGSLKENVAINAKTQAYPDKIFEGKISGVDSRINPITRSIQARAIINNTDRLLKPGLLMQVSLQKNPRQAIVVPEESLIASGKDNYVFLVVTKDNKTIAEKREVILGQRQFGDVEILSGLTEGDKIITHGTLRVRPESEVIITGVEKNNETLNELLTQKTKDTQ
jgi:membrane fusion protein (multidrug efflux system)